MDRKELIEWFEKVRKKNGFLVLSRKDRETIETLITEYIQLYEENFILASGQCCVPNGLIGDNNGHQYCSLSSKIEDLLTKLSEAKS